MKKIPVFIITFAFIINSLFFVFTVYEANAKTLPNITLSQYRGTMKIGDTCHLRAYTSTKNKPTWNSSNSSIATVNPSGCVTAKKQGTTIITAKIRGAKASCKITVLKTSLVISQKEVSLKTGETKRLYAGTSTDTAVRWKSSKKSVAAIDENGTITAKKPGKAVITATADHTNVTCKVTVTE